MVTIIYIYIFLSTTPDFDITVGSKPPFTAGFWTDSDIPVVMGDWYHFIKTNTDLQEIVSVPGSTRQCPVEQHCRFLVPTDSDGCFKSVGSWLKPAVLCKTTLSVRGSNRQCCRNHQCRLMVQADSVEQANTVGLLLTGRDGPFVIYYFIIYFNLFFFRGIGFRFMYTT